MEHNPTNLIARDDTMLGICQALGEDFGFNPFLLRLAIGTPLLWNPALAIGAYAALGVLVLFSRLIFPNPRVAAAPAAIDLAPAPARAEPARPKVEVDLISGQLLPLAA